MRILILCSFFAFGLLLGSWPSEFKECKEVPSYHDTTALKYYLCKK